MKNNPTTKPKKVKRVSTPQELDQWAVQRADESHFLEYGNLPPVPQTSSTPELAEIVKLIYKYEKTGGSGDMGLSDGFKYYGGMKAVEGLAMEILSYLNSLQNKERK